MARDGYGSVTTWSVWKAGIRIQFYSQSLSLCSSSATGPPSITIQNSLKFLGFPALLLTLGVASGCKLLQGLWWISQPKPEVSSSTYISQLCSSSVAWELQGFTERVVFSIIEIALIKTWNMKKLSISYPVRKMSRGSVFWNQSRLNILEISYCTS